VQTSEKNTSESSDKRKRLHELLVALIHQQENLELMDTESSLLDGFIPSDVTQDPAKWLDRNRRILNKYQALVRSAITLDSLVDDTFSENV
tara:strand:- start:158 stop:430 length:273 start_codon:yes stop_codon:yes gene_type:complete